MKKLIALLLVLLVTVAAGLAQAESKSPFKSKESIFTAAVLQSLYLCEEGRQQVIAANDRTETAPAAVDLLKALDTYRQGRNIMQPYTKDPDAMVNSVAGMISDGIDVFIQNGNQVAEIIERYNRDKNSVTEDESIGMALAGEEKEIAAYLRMGAATASYLPEVFCEYGRLKAPKGKITYKISKKERALLLFRIDLLFEKQLKEYYADPDHSTELIAGIAVLKKRLAAETYEEVDKINNPFPKAYQSQLLPPPTPASK